MKLLIGFFIIIFIIMIFSLGYAMHLDTQDNNRLEDFCKDNGFSYYEKGQFVWSDIICIKIENNFRVEAVVDKCGDRWCFVKNDAYGRTNE